MFIKDIIETLTDPDKKSCIEAEKIFAKENNTNKEFQKQGFENYQNDAREFKKVTVTAVWMYVDMICFTVIISSFFLIAEIQLNTKWILFLRMVSGALVFISVFNRLGDRGYFSPGYFEILNSKFWKALYLIGMSLMFFTYIVTL